MRRAIIGAVVLAVMAGCGSSDDGGGVNPTATQGALVATRTRTPIPAAPTFTPTPPIGGASVCGGPIPSVPRLCNLTVSPNPVSRFGETTIRVSVSDLEGDINQVCIGIVFENEQPVIDCSTFPPRGTTINETLTLDPVALTGFLPGSYTLGLNVGDQAGNISNAVTVGFTVF